MRNCDWMMSVEGLITRITTFTAGTSRSSKYTCPSKSFPRRPARPAICVNLHDRRGKRPLGSQKVASPAAVELDDSREADGFGGHVDADGESLGGEEEFHETCGEEDLDDLLEQRQQPE